MCVLYSTGESSFSSFSFSLLGARPLDHVYMSSYFSSIFSFFFLFTFLAAANYEMAYLNDDDWTITKQA